MNNNELYKKAINSDNLVERSKSNQKFGSNDFNEWSKKIIYNINFKTVLDICCGTGNQLVIYAKKDKIENIIGTDISQESLDKAKDRLNKYNKNFNLLNINMDKLFQDNRLINMKFDLISCFYGLYYSKNIIKILKEIIDHVNINGIILIVGPYGSNNNSSFFSLLKKYFKLPHEVVRSSSTIMKEEILPFLKNNCNIKEEYFINKISYPDVKSLIGYWKATTFYFKEYEDCIKKEIENYFKNNNEFIIEKHVMAIIAKRIK